MESELPRKFSPKGTSSRPLLPRQGSEDLRVGMARRHVGQIQMLQAKGINCTGWTDRQIDDEIHKRGLCTLPPCFYNFEWTERCDHGTMCVAYCHHISHMLDKRSMPASVREKRIGDSGLRANERSIADVLLEERVGEITAAVVAPHLKEAFVPYLRRRLKEDLDTGEFVEPLVKKMLAEDPEMREIIMRIVRSEMQSALEEIKQAFSEVIRQQMIYSMQKDIEVRKAMNNNTLGVMRAAVQKKIPSFNPVDGPVSELDTIV